MSFVRAFENNPLSNFNINQTEIMFSKTNKHASPIPKPDFTSLEKKEQNFSYKQKGSYKKPKFNMPESPMKSPTNKFFTPVKTQSNLFGSTSSCRKLNFGGTDNALTTDRTKVNGELKTNKFTFLDKLDEEIEETTPGLIKKQSSLLDKFMLSDGWKINRTEKSRDNSQNNFFKNCENEISMEEEKYEEEEEPYSKFENEYSVNKTINSGAFGIVFMCCSYLDNINYAIKMSKKVVR